jgi:beta-lactamase superfamily II metal-dependent hydrolase
VRVLINQGYPMAADVWFVPRAAGPASLDDATLRAIGPRLGIIPVDTGLRTTGPDPSTLAILARVPTYRTDLSGAIEVITDGDRVTVRPERT